MKMISDDISRVQSELRALFDQLGTTRDPSERNLLLLDCHMLLQLVGRLVKEDNQRIRQLVGKPQQTANPAPRTRHNHKIIGG
ncbi:MAG TPA: hypothetical protein VKB26_03215 [Candidatus Acidoferrales bacterium]|nr:hypothetical protein [Candidatus Acidoferrales bacterium]